MHDPSKIAAEIHPTALVEDGAQLGNECIVHAHAIVGRHCIVGSRAEVHPFAVLGGPPQDLRFDSRIESGVRIGARTVIREQVTVNRATRENGFTEIGAECFIMTGAHVAHDCRVGERVIMANAVLLGGHVQIGDHAFIGGGAVVHQHCRIGESAMIAGGARITEDVAPFCLVAERNDVIGLNLVGLRRRGFTRDVIKDIKLAYRCVHASRGNPREVAADLLARGTYASPQARQFLEFYQDGSRRLARPVPRPRVRMNELKLVILVSALLPRFRVAASSRRSKSSPYWGIRLCSASPCNAFLTCQNVRQSSGAMAP